jgi:pyrroloquinoline quinone (PQQ) biosynthesis protein C
MELLLNRPDWTIAQRESLVLRVQRHPLIEALVAGNRKARIAYLVWGWAFVYAFPGIIDRRSAEFARNIARAIGSRKTLRELTQHVKNMRNEEGEHAELWRDMGRSIGIEMPDGKLACAEMQELIELMQTAGPAEFFAGLWAVEVFANAVSALALSRGRTDRWFLVHVEHESPGHEDIDLELAQKLGIDSCRFRVSTDAVVDLFLAACDKAWEEARN